MVNLYPIYVGGSTLLSVILFIVDEKYINNQLYLFFNYGKLNIANVKSFIEVSKSSFGYFYLFAVVYSTLVWFFVIKIYLFNENAPESFIKVLDFLGGHDRVVIFSPTETLLATSLFQIQISRRFYESNFTQIFSEKAKISLVAVIAICIFYAFFISANIMNSQGFILGESSIYQKKTFLIYTIFPDSQIDQDLTTKNVSNFQIFLSVVFLLSCMEQFKSNQILIALRTDASGNQVTDKHFIPHGRLFEYISSPHFLAEILMYSCLAGIMHKSWYWMHVVCFVFTNQVKYANIVHNWYKKKFENYPKNRKALIPYLF